MPSNDDTIFLMHTLTLITRKGKTIFARYLEVGKLCLCNPCTPLTEFWNKQKDLWLRLCIICPQHFIHLQCMSQMELVALECMKIPYFPFYLKIRKTDKSEKYKISKYQLFLSKAILDFFLQIWKKKLCVQQVKVLG